VCAFVCAATFCDGTELVVRTRVGSAALRPQDPLINLCIGVAHVCSALTAIGPERHETVLRGLAFISQYKTLRSADAGGGGGGGEGAPPGTMFRRVPVPRAARVAEAEYNLGRAFHQLGLLHLAIPCYERALGALDGAAGAGEPTGGGAVDVRLEAAFNLAQLYRRTGGGALARAISHKYLVLD
jgi:general transcription factor 3C polypeptide 3 (transcription factor C subunit 4)